MLLKSFTDWLTLIGMPFSVLRNVIHLFGTIT